MLESEAEATPKARFRFGFFGKQKRTNPPERPVVTSDDILDSLTRQAAIQAGLGEQQTHSLELIAETEEPTLFTEPAVSTVAQFRRETSRRLGNYLIVIMCIGGMIVVWLYGSGRGIFDASVFSTTVPKAAVQSVFANPAQVGIMSIVAMITALWIAVRRRASRLHVPI